MKNLCTILAIALAAAFSASAKTFDWPIGSPVAKAETFAAYHGETVRFNLQFSGAMSNLAPVAIYYQTNGMARTEWFGPVPGTVFHPTNDCGAASYRFFIRCTDPDGVNYTANGTLRMLDSPGTLPNEIELPPRVIDFARVSVTNVPWTAPAEVCAIVTNTVGGGWSVAYVEYWDRDGFFDDGVTDVSYDEWTDRLVVLTAHDYAMVLIENGASWPDDDLYCGTAIADVDGISFAYVELRREPERNALGLARLSDIPDDIVTAGNVTREVARQLDGVDQVRSRQLLRTDGPSEYGTGPGVMIYDFTSDRRWWEISAPALSVSASAGSPLSVLSPGSNVSRQLVRTDGTSGSSRCASATWRVGVIELSDGSHGLDVTVTVTNGTLGAVSASGGGPGASVQYVYQSHYRYYYEFQNFRVGSVVTNSQYSVTVNGLYDYLEKYSYNSTRSFSNLSWSVSFAAPVGSYATTTNEYLRVVNSLDHHRFYDPGLGCTWQVAVTNGCFYAEQLP